MFRAIVFDLDDTLLRDDLTISDETVRVLHAFHDRGIRIIPASGRAPASILDFARRIGCCDLLIASNGAEIATPEGSILSQVMIADDVAQRILAFGNESGIYMHTYLADSFHYNRDSVWSDRYRISARLTGVRETDLPAFVRAHPTNKILMMAHRDTISALYPKACALFSREASVTTSKAEFLEFNPGGTSKGKALHEALRRMSIMPEETMVFGDGINDLSMLLPPFYGVAMKNAAPAVQEQAKDVCGDNASDGVARYLLSHETLFAEVHA